MRSRLLYPLTAAVLAAHAIALLAPGLPAWMRPRAMPAPEDLRFSTRSISPAPPPEATAPPAPAPRPAAPVRAKPAPRPAAAPPPTPPKAAPVAQPPGEPSAAAASEAPPPPPGASLDDLLGDDKNAPPEPHEASAAATDAAGAQPSAATPEPSAPATPSADPPAAPAASDNPTQGIGSAGYTGALPAARVPPSTELKFDAKGSAKGFNYSASALLQWKSDGRQYQARQEISAFLIGSRTQTSSGRIDLNGLVPQRFGDKARSERVAQFDAGPSRVNFSNGNTSAVAPGVQDRLSIFVQLASMFAAAPERYPPGSAISINTASATGTAVWTLVVDGPETLELPEGRRETLRLTRRQLPGDDQKAQLWLAPELNYLPVRIRLSQPNGDFADLALKSATPLP